MNIVVLTPDTEIDRRIILQANTLAEQGHKITIIGVPYEGDNLLSGSIDPTIEIKRINLQDLDYHSRMVRIYKSLHKKIMNFAYRRNDFLNDYSNRNLITGNAPTIKIRNKIVNLSTKLMNNISTLAIRFFQKMVNIWYTTALKILRIFNVNFFPIFDKAFYNAAIDEEAELIIANDLPSLQGAYLVAKEKKVLLVYDAHENYTEQCTLPKGYAKYLEKIEARILPDVNFWIVPNELLGEAVIEKYQKKYNVTIPEPLVIQNAVRNWLYFDEHKDVDVLREKLHLSKENKIVLFQGGFIPNRNLENLVKSFKYVKNENVVLVMLGFGIYGEILKRIAKKNKIENRIFFLEAVSQNELLKYTCSADVGVIPYPAVDRNTLNCSPNKLYEFIQARLPILANDLPFLRKVIVGNNIGKVQDFTNSKLIANAINSLFEEQTSIQDYKSKLNEIAPIFSWEIEEGKLLSHYKEIVLNVN